MPSLAEITQLCRLCLVKDQVNIPIFNGQGDIQQIFHKISTCLPVKISQEDGLPKNICDGCSHKLDMFYQFWNTSSNSEKQLLQWLKEIERSLSLEKDASVQQSHSICPDDDVVLKQEAIDIDEHNADDGIPTDDLNVPTDPDYLLQQSYGSFDYQQEAYNEEAATSNAAGPSSTVTSETAAVAAPKRKRRAAAMKPLPPQINSEDEDDPDAVETKIAKTEKLSDDEDESNPEPTTFVGLPTDNEQPGPSGVDKVTGEAPVKQETQKSNSTIIWVPVSKLSKYNIKCVWQCQLCSRQYDERYKLNWHIKMSHVTVKSFSCDVCSKPFRTKKLLEFHKQIHSDARKVYECDICATKLMSQYTLDAHKNRHLKNYKFRCRTCGKGFVVDAELKQHVLKDHENVVHSCEICGKGFKKPHSLKVHKELLHDSDSSNNETRKCEICGKSFTNKRYLLHIKRQHKNTQKYVCDICGKTVQSSTSLKDHIAHTHQGVKSLECNECGKKFAKRENLAVHMRSHTGVKPYQCQLCSKAFTQHSNLTKHARTHTGEKPYQCQLCPKAFTQRSTLTIHTRTHTGEKPYVCDICQNGFKSKSLLNKHKKSAHKVVKLA